VQDDQGKIFELDSRVGLNGSQCYWSFPCLNDEQKQRFFIWLGDVTIEKFTKTTFLNLADFAEKSKAKQMVLVLSRDHAQKGMYTYALYILLKYPNLNIIYGSNTHLKYRPVPETLQGA
jgi:hypothetical protein